MVTSSKTIYRLNSDSLIHGMNNSYYYFVYGRMNPAPVAHPSRLHAICSYTPVVHAIRVHPIVHDAKLKVNEELIKLVHLHHTKSNHKIHREKLFNEVAPEMKLLQSLSRLYMKVCT